MDAQDSLIQLLSGAAGGTMGAIVTSPLEVVKTRLQSSQCAAAAAAPLSSRVDQAGGPGCRRLSTVVSAVNARHLSCCPSVAVSTRVRLGSSSAVASAQMSPLSPFTHSTLLRSMRTIVEREGARALFKGLGPTLVGVAPARAIYFCAYHNAKRCLNDSRLPADSSRVHVASAIIGGFASSTLTNPIWLVRTRLQLDMHRYGRRLRVIDCVRRVYRQDGARGFYKGVTASYYGVVETVIYFVLYEKMKRHIDEAYSPGGGACGERTGSHFGQYMVAGAVAKAVAATTAYPHEVARTRLREEGTKYRSFFQTLRLVAVEEGVPGLYRGLGIQLLRQIPNAAILMATYEACVYFLNRRRRPSG